jgi:hypothetical protein
MSAAYGNFILRRKKAVAKPGLSSKHATSKNFSTLPGNSHVFRAHKLEKPDDPFGDLMETRAPIKLS